MDQHCSQDRQSVDIIYQFLIAKLVTFDFINYVFSAQISINSTYNFVL